MFGDQKDWAYGRQMPNHFGSRALNIVTVSSPVGTQIPHAAGCAYAMKLQKTESIAICYFGEGTSSEGDFHVGLNFAAVRKSPVIFFCRNNGYAISTPCSKQFATEGLAERASRYGMTSFCIDGNDFFAIHETVSRARAYCLAQKEPVFIEAMTYRMGAHSTSDDPSLYRTEEERKIWQEKCPILRLRRYLLKQNLWTMEQEEAYLHSVTEETSQAITIAKKTPSAPLKDLFEQIYAKVPPSLQKQYQSAEVLFNSQEK
jgi:2-oxoisovalerate dehydrogenase E1 component alpha subunit